jgi:hypothetical protein
MKSMTDRILTVEDAKELLSGKMDDDLEKFLKRNATDKQLEILWPEDFQHIAHCLKSMVADLFGLYDSGSFGKAFLANDLSLAVGRADEVNIMALSLYNKFLYNCVPAKLIFERRK